MTSAAEREMDSASTQRKMRRACDICHKRKVRCDGREMPRNRCSNCLAANVECIYTVPVITKRRGSKAHVQELENRLMNAEKLLNLISPDTDLKDILEQIDESVFDSRLPGEPPTPPVTPPLYSLSALPSYSELQAGTGDFEDSDEDYGTFSWTEERKLLSERNNQKFYGKSSSVTLFQSVLDYKKAWDPSFDCLGELRHINAFSYLKTGRPGFWRHGDWTKPLVEPPTPKYDFPEPDLLSSLVDLYFSTLNNFFPLLHRPTFEASVANGLHLRDHDFGAVVLMVCAIGARFSDDLRVMYQSSPLLSGFAWFHQVNGTRRPLLTLPCIYDIQIYCLSAMFLDGVSPYYLRWNLVGAGLRSLQEVGAHRQQAYAKPSVEGELWRRAFWIMLVLDRLTSSAVGRMCAVREEDFDVELPAECDDEYWTHPDPEQRFKQPPGKPSVISYFIQLIKLNEIPAFGLRTIYAMSKSKSAHNYRQWEQRKVAELDSAMAKWIESLPSHLRWDPNRENPMFFKQSMVLHMHYHNTQLWIHRSFIKSNIPSTESSPSFSACTNAARSFCALLDVSKDRVRSCLYMCMKAMSSAAVILLLNIWGRRPFVDPAREMAEVKKIMDVLHSLEGRWQMGGRTLDILKSLINPTEFPILSETINVNSRKGKGLVITGSNVPSPGYVPPSNIGSLPVPSPAEPWTPFVASVRPSKDRIAEVPEVSQQDIDELLASMISTYNSPQQQPPQMDFDMTMSDGILQANGWETNNGYSHQQFDLYYPHYPPPTVPLTNHPGPNGTCCSGGAIAEALMNNAPHSEHWEDWNLYAQSMSDMVKNLQDTGGL